MTLTWADIDARWPGSDTEPAPSVIWDRDVAPTLDWDPRFTELHGHLWADDPECEQRGFGRCRCMLWDRGQWSTVAHYPNGWTQHPLRAVDGQHDTQRPRWLDHEWRLEYMGLWIDPPQRPFRERVYDSARAILNRHDLRDYRSLFDDIAEPRGDLYPSDRRVQSLAYHMAAQILRIEERPIPWIEERAFRVLDWDY